MQPPSHSGKIWAAPAGKMLIPMPAARERNIIFGRGEETLKLGTTFWIAHIPLACTRARATSLTDDDIRITSRLSIRLSLKSAVSQPLRKRALLISPKVLSAAPPLREHLDETNERDHSRPAGANSRVITHFVHPLWTALGGKLVCIMCRKWRECRITLHDHLTDMRRRSTLWFMCLKNPDAFNHTLAVGWSVR